MLTQREVRDVVRSRSDRCTKCGRIITWNFEQLGLGVVKSQWHQADRGDAYLKAEAYHTFPCVGMKIRLKDVIAHYLSFVATEER